MGAGTTYLVSEAIRYIENHLSQKLELDTIAEALHYSKYHLHRSFTKTIGLTIHDYVRRRRITEAARLLAFSQKPILEIALTSGYESQQAFSDVFKAMYKAAPAAFRKSGGFYPLQLEIRLNEKAGKRKLTKNDIRLAKTADMAAWMRLVALTIDGYPCLNEPEYLKKLRQYIGEKKALILKDAELAIGAMAFSAAGSIDFLAVHPQYRSAGIAALFLHKLTDELLCGREISITTYRAGDKADTGYRAEYCRLGFQQRELLVEYGYPSQRFVFEPKNEAGTKEERGDA